MCDYSDTYIVVKGTITAEGTKNVNKRNKKLTFQKNALFRSCMSKINLLTHSLAMQKIEMYNLLECNSNCSMTSGSLWNDYRDDMNDATNEIAANRKLNNNKPTASKSFEYKTKIIGRTPANINTLDTEVVVPLTYLSNFWRFLDLPLINCEVELDLSWTKDCIIS